MSAVLLIIHIMAAIAVVVLVLLQQGKGADIGAAFGGGGGGSQSIFGSRGSANFLSHITAVLVAVFLFTSLSLAFIHQKSGEFESV
ncbi:MAG: preprotein translocase subunit SecG, partial [Gammaproteobacteria bacterium]|nr:preprotein translocase subunit SecG [Gammaproteobacteria bacterium]